MKIKSRGHREFTSCVVVLRKFTFWPLGFFVALQTRFQLFSVESCFVFLTIYYLFLLSTMFPPKRSENNLGIPQFVLLYRFVLLNSKTMDGFFFISQQWCKSKINNLAGKQTLLISSVHNFFFSNYMLECCVIKDISSQQHS